MTKNRDAKKAVRARAQKGGMSYQASLQTEGGGTEGPELTGFEMVRGCSCEPPELKAILDDGKGTLHATGNFSSPQNFGAFFEILKNLTPEIELSNYLVAAHLAFIEDQYQGIESLDIRVAEVSVTREQVTLIADKSSDDYRYEHRPEVKAVIPMPPGLYDHLLEVSKLGLMDPPRPKPPARAVKFLASLEAILFASGTVTGQKAFTGGGDPYFKHMRWAETFEAENQAAILKMGLTGRYYNPKDASDYREIYVSSVVPKGQVLMAPPGDVRTSEDLAVPIEPANFFKGPTWARQGSVIKVQLPNVGNLGEYWVEHVGNGFSAKTTEVRLISLRTQDRMVATLEDLKGACFERFMRRIPKLERLTPSFTNECVFDTFAEFVEAMLKDLRGLGDCHVLTADDPHLGLIAYSVFGKAWERLYGMHIRNLKDEDKDHPVFKLYLGGPETRQSFIPALKEVSAKGWSFQQWADSLK